MEKQALVGNAADEGQVRSAAQKEKFNRNTELSDVCMVLDNLKGRRFIWRYLGICGVDRLSFGGSNDQTNFQEGQRNVGLRLKADIIEANADFYLLMIKEAKEGKYGN